ncbi:MAG TPA: hypothetical protein VGS21_09945 [Acidimicrobiales bacterium]|nr:hypothetical protein [Acidimicrobiales bacterium]
MALLGWGAAAATTTHPAPASSKSGQVVQHASILSQPRIPTTGSYLGVDPEFATGDDGALGSGPNTTLAQLNILEGQIGRAVGIVSFYISWDQEPPIIGMQQVTAEGSIPMVSWHCGPADTAITAGQYDGLIRQDAEAYKAFGRPMFLRWFWEMNLVTNGNHPTCFSNQTDPTVIGPQYVAAYQHIYNIFQQVGATNVAFIWCPSAALNNPVSPADFYPGSSDVQWVGFDMYDRVSSISYANAMTKGKTVTYSSLLAYGKPLIQTETGAPNSGLGVGQPTQQQWLQQAGASIPTQFPAVKGLVYVDASDSAGNYILEGSGLTQFAALGRTPFFTSMP